MASSLLGDTTAWVSSLSGNASKKVGFNVLDWVNRATGGQNPPPGTDKQETAPKDFMGYLKNGVQLAKLANFLSPGSARGINENPQSQPSQLENIGKFLGFAKNIGGLGDSQLFKADDLNQGKGYTQVLSTLLQLGMNAPQQFGKQGLNADTLIQLATRAAGSGLFNNCLGCFKK